MAAAAICLLSGALYQAGSMPVCLLGSAAMLTACWLITFLLPVRLKEGLPGRDGDPSRVDAL